MKKVLSAILAAAMLIAMLPVAFATETDTEFAGYKYVFTAEAFPESFTRDSNGYILRSTLVGGNMTLDTPLLEGSSPWRIAGDRYVDNVAARPASGLDFPGFNIWSKDGDSSSCFVMELKVEDGGTYKPNLSYFATPGAPEVAIYLVKAGTELGGVKTSNFKIQAGRGNDDGGLWTFINAITEGQNGVYILKSPENPLDMHGTFSAGGSVTTETFSNRELELDGGTSYFLIFRRIGSDGGKQISLDSFSLTPVQDEELTGAFKPDDSVTAEDYSEPAVISITKDGSEIKSEKNSDGTHNITAPETNKAGAKFLYWAKGLTSQKRILIGETNELKNYVPDAEYANYLIPVYENEISGTEYYNANGQLLPDANQETEVSMAGYGASNGWDQYGETNIYVAHYDLAKPEKNIDVTVTGGTGTDTYAFGDTVTCTATGTGTFKCWTKSDIYGTTEPEIVSVDETYTFKAWEDCTVTAVYEDHHYTGNTMKIIIDTFTAGNETGVMAEFIGLDNAVEKGIMFTDSKSNTTKIAMTTKDNQFTVIADETGTYEGYAIVGNAEDGYTLITDGSYEHTK